MVAVLLAWLYVAVVFALAQPSLVRGVAVLILLGVLPLSLLGRVLRRRRRRLGRQREERLNT